MVMTMSQEIFCRLCVNISKEYKILYADNEVYETTVKYFDSMFLNAQPQLTALCLECWYNMFYFHKFQLSVAKRQRKVIAEEGIPNGVVVKKEEPEEDDETSVNLCRLCLNHRKDFTCLTGDIKVFQIVAKYFDSMFVNMKGITAICLECWSHILDFHKFQEFVLDSQTKLNKNELRSSPVIAKSIVSNSYGSGRVIAESEKTPFQDDQFTECNNGEVSCSFTICDVKEEPDMFSLPELELIDVHNENQSSFNDEMPLKQIVANQNDTYTVVQKENRLAEEHISSTLASKVLDSMDYGNSSWNEEEDEYDIIISQHNNAEKKKSIQELDKFIAQWRPTLECVVCYAACPTFTLLQKHFEKMHPNEQCFIFCCQCKLKSQYYIVEHIRFHIDPNIFKCRICDHCNTTRLNLKRHMEYWHPGSSKQSAADCSTALVCTECGKTAKTQGALRKHMQRHVAKRKFKCSICDKGFRGRNDLNTHLATHKPNGCPHCSMTFKYLSKLKTHLAQVHGN